MRKHNTGVVIAGGGLAGMVTALELLDAGENIILIEKDAEDKFGGLARESFGGIHLIGTPHQRRLGIKDTPELALSDWLRRAEFGPDDQHPRAWAEFYCANSIEWIYRFLIDRGVRFLPLVNWPERGLDRPLNSVPRWHIAWGTGYDIIARMRAALATHPQRKNLEIWFRHEVGGFDVANGRVVGVYGKSVLDQEAFRVGAEHVVVASGGICGGDLSVLRQHWPRHWGQPPETILNGAHPFADGLLHERASQQAGASVTHLDRHWHYATGVHHPANHRAFDGLSLVPPRSALWFNAVGERIFSPGPLVGYTDTLHLVESILRQPGGYSWQVLNRKIALKELAVSGAEYMTAFRYKKPVKMLADSILGNRELVDRLVAECPQDIVVANSLDELAERMTGSNLHDMRVDAERLKTDVHAYDAEIDRGKAFFNDEQLRRIVNFRSYRGDRMRLCRFQKIDDPKARPLMAIREFILSRKSLGGLQTDLGARVLTPAGSRIAGLYAVGEAAGFGGGGIHGKGSLEGTFLGSCVLTGRSAGKTIAQGG